MATNAGVRRMATGECSENFMAVKESFQQLFDDNWDIGSAVTVFHNGLPVVELSGGVLDYKEPQPRPYAPNTLQLVASSTKFAESLCIALLVDRGLLSYDAKIVDYWPDFAKGDPTKKSITVRQLMMHRAGLPNMAAPLTNRELFNHDEMKLRLEMEKVIPDLYRPENTPWTSGQPTPQCYHAVTRGLYSGALLRIVDPQHRTLGKFWRDEIADPLNLDFFIGLPLSEEGRVGKTYMNADTVVALKEGKLDDKDPRFQLTSYEKVFWDGFSNPNSLPGRMMNFLKLDNVAPHELANHRDLRACEMPSSNGLGSSRALASMAALVCDGGKLFGKRIFKKPETLLEALLTSTQDAEDRLFSTTVRITQGGFGRWQKKLDYGHHEVESVGWGGAGGSMVRFVPTLRLSLAYVSNTMGIRMAMNDPRPNRLLAQAMTCALKLARK